MTAYSQRAITQEGLERLEKDLERLRNVERPSLAERLQSARETPGDPGDNLEFLEAQQDLAMLEGRIAELEVAIANAWVQEAPNDGTIGVGSKFVVRDGDGEEDHYTLVGSAEANPRGGLISVESPVGRALLHAQKGDKVQVETPSGHRELEVLEVS
jgi:transcription elongation factor GreA